MELTTSQKQLKKVAGVLGILQGLAWTVMSLTCIILYLQKRKFFFPTSYMEEVNAVIYEIFLNRANEGFTQQLLTPRVFTGFMWVYFLIDVAWLLASVNMLNKNGGELRLALRAWVYVTIIVCILDLITVIILGSDYEKCLEFMRRINSENTVYLEAECANGILPVLVITAKGFFFWIVNVIFARIIFKIAKRLKQPVRPVPIGFPIRHIHPAIGIYPQYRQYPPSPTATVAPETFWNNNYPKSQEEMHQNYRTYQYQQSISANKY